MSGTSTLPSPPAVRFALTLALTALCGATSCWNNVGIVCPESDPSCNGADLQVTVTPDLASPPRDSTLISEVDSQGGPTDLTLPDPVTDAHFPPDLSCLANCADGCCDEKGCHKPLPANTCGRGGSCQVCDPIRSRGACDQNGACGCNGGPMCGPGQECDANKGCICTATSCPQSCCIGNMCMMPPPMFPVCGSNGNVCLKCGPDSDSCSAKGECSCKINPGGLPCGPGMKCDPNMGCVCDPLLCAGCCVNNKCEAARPNQCVLGGGKGCFTCDRGSDSCSLVNGVAICTCGGIGGALTCGPGQFCNGGKCACDQVSCLGGCCDNNQRCVNNPGACGPMCAKCLNAQLCVVGTCAQVVNFCLQGMFVCAANKACVPTCAKCLFFNAQSAQCGSACVQSCAECADNKTCLDANGANPVCISDCKNCPSNKCQ